MNQANQTCIAAPSRDIPEALKELQQNLSVLDDRIEVLNGRLQSALTSYPEAPVNGCGAPVRSKSGLAEVIDGQTDRIARLAAQVERIINELQI